MATTPDEAAVMKGIDSTAKMAAGIYQGAQTANRASPAAPVREPFCRQRLVGPFQDPGQG